MSDKTKVDLGGGMVVPLGELVEDDEDLDGQTDPRWYVLVDETPICPDRPLTAIEAVELFKEIVPETADGSIVEIHQCSAEDLEWAGGFWS